MPFAGRPIIGIVGGIGSGKSFVAALFGELGCRVIDSDRQVHDAYRSPQVKTTLKEWWGGEVLDPAGNVDKRAVGRRVFSDPAARRRLEQLLHPIVAQARDAAMRAVGDDAQIVAFVWDTPLLFEVGLDAQCDDVVFVDAPFPVRLARVQSSRGWDEAELTRRQNLQWPLDKKREMSDHRVTNTADVGVVRDQVRKTLSRILAGTSVKPEPQV